MHLSGPVGKGEGLSVPERGVEKECGPAGRLYLMPSPSGHGASGPVGVFYTPTTTAHAPLT